MPRNGNIEPSIHSTPQVDEFLEERDETVDDMGGPGSPAIKPNRELDDNGDPIGEPRNPKI